MSIYVEMNLIWYEDDINKFNEKEYFYVDVILYFIFKRICVVKRINFIKNLERKCIIYLNWIIYFKIIIIN